MTEEEKKKTNDKKALEAAIRVKTLRHNFLIRKAFQINFLILSQSTAVEAVRLQTLLPPIPQKVELKDMFTKKQRMRIETLLEDERGIEIGRVIC
ncbi:protein LKAAEAR1-like isoform X2 [Hydra vulgaris]|uniref:Protein LKAAEAR1-like isoform X2 n=1 Tax=Hydra vulgaris TaxID=6087 RepID=A0ABM4BR59_HYDVU